MMKHQLELILTGDERGRKFKEFADSLGWRYPGIEIHRKTEEDSGAPALLMSPHIRLEALPTDKWEKVFLNLLQGHDSALKTTAPLDQLPAAVRLKLYITPSCPFCPQVLRELLPLAAQQPSWQLLIIDGEMFPEKAAADQVRAAPTLILDDQVRWTGTVNMAEVVSIIRDRDPSILGADSMRTLIENGAAGELAHMMAASKKIFPAFLDLLTHEKWPLRLGAMVTFEYLLEQDRALANEVLELLWKRFDRLDDGLKGDMLHLFGQSGGQKIMGYLETILKGSYSVEVLEAATEAREAILSQES